MSRSSMEPPTPLAGYTSKKRVFMDAEVIEIAPPISRTPKVPKQKEVIHFEVIDVDNYEDSADVMVLDDKVDTRNKGKAIKHDSDGSGNYQPKEALTNHLFSRAGVETFGLVNGVGSSKSSAPGSDNLINLDSDLSCEDENIDIYYDDFMDFDQYAMLQAHFDSMDIPAGVEATVPWYPDLTQNKKKTVTGSNSFYTQGQMQSDHGIDPSLSSWPSKPTHFNMNPISGTNLSLQTPVGALSNPGGVDLSSPWSLSHTAYDDQNQAASQHGGNSLNHPSAVESSESRRLMRSKPVASNSSTDYSSVKKLDAMTLPFGVEPPYWGHNASISVKNQAGPNDLVYSTFPPQMINHPPVVEPSMTWWQKPLKSNFKSVFGNYTTHSSVYDPFDDEHIPPEDEHHIDWGQDSPRNQKSVDEEDILRKFQIFKKFDTVEDHSDHHYASRGSSMKQPSKNWAKKIQEEWRILEKDLPDTIFVRVYESRMDLLRAVIVGAEGTPYHDGLFFFDVLFPDAYPNVPPLVYYHSGGLRLNPNLYNCGKVCLSLLNTWSGNKDEMWIPSMSTMLQVLVSIQALILNQKPFFNEPGYAGMSGSANGELRSQQYNENTFILSLKTMLYSMRKPPKHFNDFVVGHFYKRAHDILVACKAYMDGAQVGCLVKGGVQDVDEGDKSCSKKFKDSLAGYVNMLVKEFTQIGAKDCEKFLTQGKKGNKRVGNMPKAAK